MLVAKWPHFFLFLPNLVQTRLYDVDVMNRWVPFSVSIYFHPAAKGSKFAKMATVKNIDDYFNIFHMLIRGSSYFYGGI